MSVMDGPTMSEEPVPRGAAEAERNERARRARLRHDGARSPSENLRDGIALARQASAFFGVARPRREV